MQVGRECFLVTSTFVRQVSSTLFREASCMTTSIQEPDAAADLRRWRLSWMWGVFLSLPMILFTVFAAILAPAHQESRRQWQTYNAVKRIGGEFEFKDECCQGRYLDRVPMWQRVLGVSLPDQCESIGILNDKADDAFLGNLKNVRELERLLIQSKSIKGPGLQYLGEMQQLRSLDIGYCSIDDAGLSHLPELSRLDFLSLAGTNITDKGLGVICRAPQLKRLDLTHTNVDGSGFWQLLDGSSLYSINLHNTPFHNEGLQYLAEMESLCAIDLSGTQVTDEGLLLLCKLKSLRSLNLSKTKITDQGLAHLKPLSSLRSLDISDTQITDTGLVHLRQNYDLQSLSLSGTQVTFDGVSYFIDCRLFGTRKTWGRPSQAPVISLPGGAISREDLAAAQRFSPAMQDLPSLMRNEHLSFQLERTKITKQESEKLRDLLWSFRWPY